MRVIVFSLIAWLAFPLTASALDEDWDATMGDDSDLGSVLFDESGEAGSLSGDSGELGHDLAQDLAVDPGLETLPDLTPEAVPAGPAPKPAERTQTPAAKSARVPNVTLPPDLATRLEQALEPAPDLGANRASSPVTPAPAQLPVPTPTPIVEKSPSRALTPALPPVSISGPAAAPELPPLQALPKEPAATSAAPPPPSGDASALSPGDLPPLPPASTPAAASGAGPSTPSAAAPAESPAPEPASGPVTIPGDVELLARIQQAVDPDGRLGWKLGDRASGPGIAAEKGRLVRLKLPAKDLKGLLVLEGTEKLEEAASEGNPFTDLTLVNLPALRSLTLSGLALDRLKTNDIGGLPSLAALSLPQGRLAEIEPGALAGPARLESLTLTGNQLTRLGRNTFSEMPTLTELYLDHNRLREVAWGALAPLSNLSVLHLGGNRLTEVGNGFFPGLTHLEILHLEDNRIARITPEAFAGLTSLKLLDLSDNQLSGFSPSLVSALPALGELDLARNSLPLSTLKALRDGLPPGLFPNFTGQREVYFTLRVQYLPKIDHFAVPAEDAFIDNWPSHGLVLGDDPRGAAYAPPNSQGQPGRLTFRRPGLYRLALANTQLSPDPAVSATTGFFLVVDQPLDVAEGVKKIGNRDLVTSLAKSLSARGYVEVSGYNPKRVAALAALFGVPAGALDQGEED